MTYEEECTKWFAPADEIAEALRNNEGLCGLSHEELKKIVISDSSLMMAVDTKCNYGPITKSSKST